MLRVLSVLSLFGMLSLVGASARADAKDVATDYHVVSVAPNTWSDVGIVVDGDVACPDGGTVRTVVLADQVIGQTNVDRMTSAALAALLSGRPVKFRLQWVNNACQVTRLTIH